ncbi:FAD-dependent monooxygenase [Pseudosulfitobacter sp. SM2401]|uniref:FAD-dependent monooxygenase n=1 Tax=Pseudosulfitobacter sp. SM2401 TaxID=3350098 RepID=UPI0036F25929
MQYHLNGYTSGDPAIHSDQSDATDTLPEAVDVLIVGCGPTGLTLAAYLAQFPDITTCIVDQKPGPLKVGQADGIACRTIEMFQAFGFAEKVVKEAYWVNETCFWKPDPDAPQNITHTNTIKDTEDGLSEFPHVILNQARVHDFYLEVMRNGAASIQPVYSQQLEDVVGNTATFAHTQTGTRKTVTAKYIIGCEGARSTVRKSIGRKLQGDSANKGWGVMDILAVTDFPDIRRKAVVQSASEGSILIIPREGGYMVRMYIELEKLPTGERVSGQNVTVDQLIAAAQRILHPHKLDVKDVVWWSVYDIGQRLCDRFDNGSKDSDPTVFIAGDSCHTHSPKAGQGMNVSMGDAFNLGWKLAGVLRGTYAPGILNTYTQERQTVAQELIDFDREFARQFSAPVKSDRNPDGVDPQELERTFIQAGRFTAGTAIRYYSSNVCGDEPHQELATGFPVGMRFHSAPVMRWSDGKPMHLGHTVVADGRWRVFAFADRKSVKLNRLCDWLDTDPHAPIQTYTPKGADSDNVIDLRAIYQTGDLTAEGTPPILMPSKGRFGLTDYEKIFYADHDNDIFDLRGIDRTSGCIVVVRPDQYVAHVLPLDDHAGLSAFFDRFMRRPTVG